jgi:hypothetical protein
MHFVVVVSVPFILYIGNTFPEFHAPLWAVLLITLLLIIGPVSPSLLKGRNVFHKNFKITDQD